MKKKTGVTVIGAFVALIAIAVALGMVLVKKYTPSEERGSYAEAYPVEEGRAHVIFWQKEYEKKALIQGEGLYLDLETVLKYINEDFYYDEEEKVLSYVLPTELIRARHGEDKYYSNEEERSLKSPAVTEEKGKPYISLEFAALFSDVTYTYYTNPARVLLRNGSQELLSLNTKVATVVRQKPSIKSPILCDAAKDSVVWYVDAGTEGNDKFVKILTQDGIYGFIQKKDLSDTYYVSHKSEYETPVFSHNVFPEKIVLGWHLVTNSQANAGLENKIKGIDQLNVISPTWFRLGDIREEGWWDNPISSIADTSYVQNAKAKGLAVWGLIDDFNVTDAAQGFSSRENSYKVLASTKARTCLIDALIAEAIRCDLDGINIDFELIALEAGPHYIQFLRELSVKCRRNGIVLSVDNYVPSAGAAYYDLASQAEVVDYVIIMAYDEHNAGSETAGSVASYGFLTSAVDSTLAKVPKEQIIMGVPFFARLWKETEENGVTKLASEALGMETAQKELSRNGVTPEWDDVTKQYYAEYEKGNTTYKIWLEEFDSLRQKLLYIKNADLAGTAAWSLGLEASKVWPLFDWDVLE